MTMKKRSVGETFQQMLERGQRNRSIASQQYRNVDGFTCFYGRIPAPGKEAKQLLSKR
jgi:hypothetical protein